MSQCSEGRRLIENLSNDFRTLSGEAKKKHNSLKEAAELGLVKVRNISSSTNEENLLRNVRAASSEILPAFLAGCHTRNSRLVQISLLGIQRMVQQKVVDKISANMIVNELWNLMEAACEELRILQTLAPLVGSELIVTGDWLAKCLVICFRLKFAKDSVVINTAMATVRHLVMCVFDRVVQEDIEVNDQPSASSAPAKNNTKAAVPPSLKLCATDAYMLFKDLCSLINAESPVWLIGIHEMTRTLGLELLESIIAGFPSTFIHHGEFGKLLKDYVCPLVIKLFAPSQRQMQISSQQNSSVMRYALGSNVLVQMSSVSSDRPFFPIFMRLLRIVTVLITNFYTILLTECEIFLSLLARFLEADKHLWQQAITLEVLHRIVTKPALLTWFCTNYDERPNSDKMIETISSKISAYIEQCFLHCAVYQLRRDEMQSVDSTVQNMQSVGFLHKNVWIPLHQDISRRKSILLDSLEKHESTILPDGYTFSLAYICIVDLCQSVFDAIDPAISAQVQDENVYKSIFQSSFLNLLKALSILLSASIDETITDHILQCFSSIVSLACRLNHTVGRDAAMFLLCRAALPAHYFVQVFGNNGGFNSLSGLIEEFTEQDEQESYRTDGNDGDLQAGQVNNIVAIGAVCPTPVVSSVLVGKPIAICAKNVRVSRILIACVQENGMKLGDCWHASLASIQHLVWILGMKPCFHGGFRTDSDGIDSSLLLSSNSNSVSTTAIMTEVPILSSILNKLFDSTSSLDDVALHHVIAALCKLSNETMLVSQNGNREPSFFPIAKLLQTATANLSRIEVFWKPVTAHLIEICGHNYPKLREWGAEALTALVKSAFKVRLSDGDSKQQQLVLSPLTLMCEIKFADVRKKQSDCLLKILQSFGQQLAPDQWIVVINILSSLVNERLGIDESLIKLSYGAVALIVTDFLEVLPFDSLRALVETDAKYGAQQWELNISLSALGQLWTISDFINRKRVVSSLDECESVWLVLYNCLSELCVDSRPPVRKSACQTLLQTIFAHGVALRASAWIHMIWKVLFPMLDKVRILACSASTTRIDSSTLGASNMIVHHSRDTDSKQWAETSVLTLSGVIKIFNSQGKLLLGLEDIVDIWTNILQYIENLVAINSSEVSLASLKGFQELIMGKVVNFGESGSKSKYVRRSASSSSSEDQATLPESILFFSWQTWIRMAQALLQSFKEGKEAQLTLTSPDQDEKNAGTRKDRIPGANHFTTLITIFPSIFELVQDMIEIDSIRENGILSIFQSIVTASFSFHDPFITTNSSELTPLQAGIFACCRVIYQEMSCTNSKLRPAVPDLLRLLLNFSLLCVGIPEGLGNRAEMMSSDGHYIILFGENAMRLVVEFYANTAHFNETIQSAVLVDIIKCFAQPMQMKYLCPSQSSWRCAVSVFINVSRLGIPIARQHPRIFQELWPTFHDGVNQFLFMHGKSPNPLSSDERKRHEFIDCQLIDLMRTEILPYVSTLPQDFVQQIIGLLNRGSISCADSSDILEKYTQRADLCKVCFDALLSMSRHEEPDVVSSSTLKKPADMSLDDTNSTRRNLQNSFREANCSASPSNLGSSAITSLLSRSKQVLLLFIRDEQNAGHFRMPQERMIEMISVLNAINTLIESIHGRNSINNSEFFMQLVALYPVLIDCIRGSRIDSQVERSLISTLKCYRKLFLMQSLPH